MLYTTEARCWKCRAPVPAPAAAQTVPMPTPPPVAPGVGAAGPAVPLLTGGSTSTHPLPPGYGTAPPPPVVPLPPRYGTAPPPVARPTRVGSGEGDQAAIWAFVCGILGFVCCQLLGPVAIVLGVKAKNQGSTSGFATAGIVLGILACLVVVVQIVVIAVPMILTGGL
jgi:hypothetical protein